MLTSFIDTSGLLAGLAMGGAIGTAMAGAWRNKALTLWREQAEALKAQNDTLRGKLEDLEKIVAGMEGELKHLRAQPDFARLSGMIEQSINAADARQQITNQSLQTIAAQIGVSP